MATQDNTGFPSMIAGEDLEPWRRVKLSSSGRTMTYADSGDRCHGVTQDRVSSGGHLPIKAMNSGGTFRVEASEAISAAADVYPADDGKVAASGSGDPFGTAIDAASDAGEIIEVIRKDEY